MDEDRERPYTLVLKVEIEGYGKTVHMKKTAYNAAKALHYSFQSSGVRVYDATDPGCIPELVEFDSKVDDGNEPELCAPPIRKLESELVRGVPETTMLKQQAAFAAQNGRNADA